MRHEELHGYDPSGSVRHGPGRYKYLLWRGYGKYIQPSRAGYIRTGDEIEEHFIILMSRVGLDIL